MSISIERPEDEDADIEQMDGLRWNWWVSTVQMAEGVKLQPRRRYLSDPR